MLPLERLIVCGEPGVALIGANERGALDVTGEGNVDNLDPPIPESVDNGDVLDPTVPTAPFKILVGDIGALILIIEFLFSRIKKRKKFFYFY